MMNVTVYIVSIVGLISSVFTTTINFLLIWRTIKNEKKMHQEFTLFFYRFILDVLMGLTLGIYLGLVVVYLLYPVDLEFIRSHVGLLGLPSSNAAAARAIVAMLISAERNLAMYTPIFYHKQRRQSLYIFIFLMAVLFGLFEDVVLFFLCGFSPLAPAPPSCVAFGCAVGSCFKNYWESWKMVIFAITFTSAVTLCCKLIYWKYFSPKHPLMRMSRANRLALIDASTVLIFDFLPSFCANLWPSAPIFSFQHVGPYNAVCKLFGSAVDAVLAYQVMVRSSSDTPRDHSSSTRQHNKIKATSTVDCML